MTEPHDRPDAWELVAAVREFLERDVMDATEGRVQFHTRVAVNALRIVERELSEGPAMAAEHRERLHGLGFANDGELAVAIRSGALDERWNEVTEAVYNAVVEKVRVANPGYLAEDEGGG